MHDHRTATVNIDAAELQENVRTVEELFLLLGECDLSHCEGDEDEKRDRAGQALAWLMGQANVGAYAMGSDMNDLPYDAGDIDAARLGVLTAREAA